MTGSADFFLQGRKTAQPGGPVAILADAIDFKTGEYLSIERGFDATDGAVMTAFRTARASGSAVQDTGQKFREQKFITSGLETFFREEVAFALRRLTESKQVRIISVDIPSDDDWAEAQTKYQNLVSGQEHSTPLPKVN